MADLNINGSVLGNSLQQLLSAADIQPGDAPSYQICKLIFSFHPLGAKIADAPIAMAQSQDRDIAIPKGPEDRLREAFVREWSELGAAKHIFNLGRLSRIYGISSVALLAEGVPTDRPVNYQTLWDQKISFNVLDPLNTAGSLVLNQDANSMDFQKTTGISVSGQAYHRSRTVTLLNEDPLYIEYTTSAFGFVGRSAYQRVLFMLKSYIQTLLTDDLITLKAGVLVSKVEQAGSIVDNVMAAVTGQKRELIKSAAVGNVLSIGLQDEIASLDLKNLEGPYKLARANIIENIASGAPMPAKILNAETFAEGFGEGTEDAKAIAQYIDGIRHWLDPAYAFFDKICRYRAWNPEFYKTIQSDFPEEYGKKGYTQAFYEWTNSFEAKWPSLLIEPESERIKVDDVKLKAAIALFEVLGPQLDPENKTNAIQWLCDTFSQLKLLFPNPLILDYEALKNYTPPDQMDEPGEPKPFATSDAMTKYDAAVARLPERKRASR